MEESRRILLAIVRESYGRVVYSHKTHEKCADILLANQHRIRVVQIILSALTTAGYVTAILGTNNRTATIIGLTISTLLLAINAYMKDYDLGQLAQRHRQAASDIWLAREEYQSLIADLLMGDTPVEDLRKRRDKLARDLSGVYRGAPSTFPKAYRQAQHALQHLGDMTFSDKEIDAFLPKELQSTSTKT